MNINKHKQVLNQIKEDWRSYLIGVGSSYPPNEEEYKLFFERMVANITDAETIEPKHPVFYWRE